MRLDKFLSETGEATRSEVSKAARSGLISVNGNVVSRADIHIDPEKDEIVYCDKKIVYRRFSYIMLNKPEGFVSATEDGQGPTVLDLLPPELNRIGLFPCGRLDKNTIGLMLLTNNGPLAHKLLAPKSHVTKKYAFESKFPISEADISALEAGIDIGGYVTAPCRVEMSGEREGVITICEGKYHQIKLMLTAVHNQIKRLERISFGPLVLDPTLARGQWRYLAPDEQTQLEGDVKRKIQ